MGATHNPSATPHQDLTSIPLVLHDKKAMYVLITVIRVVASAPSRARSNKRKGWMDGTTRRGPIIPLSIFIPCQNSKSVDARNDIILEPKIQSPLQKERRKKEKKKHKE